MVVCLRVLVVPRGLDAYIVIGARVRFPFGAGASNLRAWNVAWAGASGPAVIWCLKSGLRNIRMGCLRRWRCATGCVHSSDGRHAHHTDHAAGACTTIREFCSCSPAHGHHCSSRNQRSAAQPVMPTHLHLCLRWRSQDRRVSSREAPTCILEPVAQHGRTFGGTDVSQTVFQNTH